MEEREKPSSTDELLRLLTMMMVVMNMMIKYMKGNGNESSNCDEGWKKWCRYANSDGGQN